MADFRVVLIPAQVWQEVEHHRTSALTNPELALQKVSVAISREASFQTLVRALALATGEQAALSLMAQQPEAILLTDDAAARLAGVTLGYKVHGSIGVLLRAMRRQQRTRDEILAILRHLPTLSTLYIRPGLLQEIIAEVESQS